MRSTGDVFGGKAIELAGRTVKPEFQAHGIGSKLLKHFVAEVQPQYLATYTRNPSILKMLAKVCGFDGIYPLVNNPELSKMAQQMAHATQMQDGFVYHVDRYGPDGLFGDGDPAELPVRGDLPLKQEFTGLQSVSNTLIVVGRCNYDQGEV